MFYSSDADDLRVLLDLVLVRVHVERPSYTGCRVQLSPATAEHSSPRALTQMVILRRRVALLLQCLHLMGFVSGCRHKLPETLWSVVWPERHTLPVMLYGIEGSADLTVARARLDGLGICYGERHSCEVPGVGNLMVEGCSDALLDYMRCEVFVFGGATAPQELQSFLWLAIPLPSFPHHRPVCA
jgi:hypothetical protein